MLDLRHYQTNISDKATKILQEFNIVALYMEVRTWKTITALETIKKYWSKKVLFITKKKAISSIENDYRYFENIFDMQIINYESLHKVESNFDLVVVDEAHKLATYPKPNKSFKDIKKRFWKLPIILLTWTPSPESYSQFFHQFFVSQKWPWSHYTNFYKWAYSFVEKWIVYTSYWQSFTYSNANYDKIMRDISHLIITYTQKEAWFISEIQENILHVKMQEKTYNIVNRLKKDKIVEWKKDLILADTSVKEMQKVHQLYSWTIKLEDWRIKVLDCTKWYFIQNYFKWKKIWIFYKFKAEKVLLKKVFWDSITDDLDEFNNTDKNIMLQIVSGREWISLKNAQYLVYYNIDFSAVSYWQSRDRLTTIDRKNNTVYWIFSEDWIEELIYKVVLQKKNFTKKIYERTINTN